MFTFPGKYYPVCLLYTPFYADSHCAFVFAIYGIFHFTYSIYIYIYTDRYIDVVALSRAAHFDLVLISGTHCNLSKYMHTIRGPAAHKSCSITSCSTCNSKPRTLVERLTARSLGHNS